MTKAEDFLDWAMEMIGDLLEESNKWMEKGKYGEAYTRAAEIFLSTRMLFEAERAGVLSIPKEEANLLKAWRADSVDLTHESLDEARDRGHSDIFV